MVTKDKFIRIGGWAFMLTASIMFALFFSAKIDDGRFKFTATYQAVDTFFWILFPILIGLGYRALQSHYQNRLSWLGEFSLLAGIVTAIVGFISAATVLVLQVDILFWHLKLFIFLSSTITMMLFGIDSLRGRYLPRWNFTPFGAGFVYVLGIFFQLTTQKRPWGPTPFDPSIDNGPLVFAIGIFLIGYMLQQEGKSSGEAS